MCIGVGVAGTAETPQQQRTHIYGELAAFQALLGLYISHRISSSRREEGIVVIPFSQMRKPRLRRPLVGKRRGEDLNADLTSENQRLRNQDFHSGSQRPPARGSLKMPERNTASQVLPRFTESGPEKERGPGSCDVDCLFTHMKFCTTLHCPLSGEKCECWVRVHELRRPQVADGPA